MPIISMSVNENLLSQIDDLGKELGYSGRSEIIRAALRALIAEQKNEKELRGNVNGVVLLVKAEGKENKGETFRHTHKEIISTMLHYHTKEDHRCAELFVIEGKAEKVLRLLNELRANKGMDYVKFIQL